MNIWVQFCISRVSCYFFLKLTLSLTFCTLYHPTLHTGLTLSEKVTGSDSLTRAMSYLNVSLEYDGCVTTCSTTILFAPSLLARDTEWAPKTTYLGELQQINMGVILVFCESWQDHVVNCEEMKLCKILGSNVKLKNDEILNIKDKGEVPNSSIQQSLSLMTAYLSRGLAQS